MGMTLGNGSEIGQVSHCDSWWEAPIQYMGTAQE